ncbi:hypothetical protein EXIGLDRAFT_730890 [Exidia glandulosa HHB12029]|uniref:Uncharacterized protein n=1 Tax=Exidia glandulosa HHB12029 TaxID=1314781 RepID=A0A165PWX3_EXIGL|nr:hypothetical protein EXIGLDRAFT_730890 [Exidia glandulosa HHB12029]
MSVPEARQRHKNTSIPRSSRLCGHYAHYAAAEGTVVDPASKTNGTNVCLPPIVRWRQAFLASRCAHCGSGVILDNLDAGRFSLIVVGEYTSDAHSHAAAHDSDVVVRNWIIDSRALATNMDQLD